MRIINGKLGGLFISPPKNMPNTRPTTQIAKAGLFNILNNYIDFNGIITLDLFGGTGSISYELYSRGAEKLEIVEKDPKMHAFIKSQVNKFNIKNINIYLLDIFVFLNQCKNKFDFIFAGPPYSLIDIEKIPDIIFEKNILNKNCLFVLEHTPKNIFSKHNNFMFSRNYGTTVFTFFIQK